jgi:hypothetical protein
MKKGVPVRFQRMRISSPRETTPMSNLARTTLMLSGLLLSLAVALPFEGRAQAVSGSISDEVEAPNVTGMAVQGISVDLEYFRGDKNVLLVFYRMYN